MIKEDIPAMSDRECSRVSSAVAALVDMPRLLDRNYVGDKYVTVGVQTEISCIVNEESLGPAKRKKDKNTSNSTTLSSGASSDDARANNYSKEEIERVSSHDQQLQLLLQKQQQRVDNYLSSDDEVHDDTKKLKLPKRYKVGFAERSLGVCLYPTDEEISGVHGNCIKRGVIGQVHKRNYYVEVNGERKRHNATCICSRSRGTKGLVCYNCEQIGCNGLSCEPLICRVRIEPMIVDAYPFPEYNYGKNAEAPTKYSDDSD